MRLTISLILLAALAGCGSGQKAGNSPAANAPAAAPATPAPPPAQSAAPAAPASGDEARGLAEYREDSLRGCIAGGRETAPPGTPVEQHCACTVERMMAGKTLAELQAEERSGDYDSRFQATIRSCMTETAG